MSLRSKLTMGLGFLFVIIFAVMIYSSYNVQRLSTDADRILKDNYNSLVYCTNMLVAADDMRSAVTSQMLGAKQVAQSNYSMQLFESSKAAFEGNLLSEKNNITEVHEADYVEGLVQSYSSYLSLCLKVLKNGGNAATYANDLLPSYLDTRQRIININDLNMQAIERKNQSTKQDARSMITSTAAVGAVCLILAFFYFWYFPFYISNTISFLSTRMSSFLDSVGIRLDIRTKDEAFILLQSIGLLENKYGKQAKPKSR